MQSMFGRAAAIFAAKRIPPAPAETCLEKMVARQKAVKAAGIIGRLSGVEPEQATAPLYHSSVYGSCAAGEEPYEP